ncbi:MAG: hypothetical protein ACXVFK_11385 [Solirubrobacteraceae bacterium]
MRAAALAEDVAQGVADDADALAEDARGGPVALGVEPQRVEVTLGLLELVRVDVAVDEGRAQVGVAEPMFAMISSNSRTAPRATRVSEPAPVM